MHDDGRETPLPQYQKTNQSVPFNLTLQEDKNHPGQFQLVVNIDPDSKKGVEEAKPAASKKLYTNLQAFPGLGYDVSPLYQTRKSSPPTSPQQEKGWSDLDAIPSDFLKKVVPDWEVTFQRKDSTASTQSRKLADIKARIKKSGKGFVVRLLKGSTPESNEVAEVHLGRDAGEGTVAQELDSCPQAELDASETVQQGSDVSQEPPYNVFEMGIPSRSTTPKLSAPAPALSIPAIPHWLQQISTARNSIFEEGFSDAETLAQDVHSIRGLAEDDSEPFSASTSHFPTRTASVTSIVKTPTRGLSVVGPVTRIKKAERGKMGYHRGKSARLDLNRSDAMKSFKRRSPRTSASSLLFSTAAPQVVDSTHALGRRPSQKSRSNKEDSEGSSSDGPEHRPVTRRRATLPEPESPRQTVAKASTDDFGLPKQKVRLRLQTNVPRTKSAKSSPALKRDQSHRMHKRTVSSSSVRFAEETRHSSSPAWSEAESSEELREALEKAFGTVPDEVLQDTNSSTSSIPRIQEPLPEEDVGAIPLPSEFEIRSPPRPIRSPMLRFCELAIGALSEQAINGVQALRDRYGSEPSIPQSHVRIRWTCSCGEPLYDDFIERRPGAARLLEAYLNRPRSHAPTSPASRTSTSTSMSSVFSSASRASTLATPASTYGGFSGWGKNGSSSKLSPTSLGSGNPFSVRIGGYPEEQWLLTCANEGRLTPKIVHLDVNTGRIKSDKDLALALREHYEQLNWRWLKWARLRGLTTIEFVQVGTNSSFLPQPPPFPHCHFSSCSNDHAVRGPP